MRNQKGITLIALVITIIVLLILAGVSIAMLTGDNGILTQSTAAKTETKIAEVEEKINLTLNAVKTTVYAEKVDLDTFTGIKDDDTLEDAIVDVIKKDLTTTLGEPEPKGEDTEVKDGKYYYALSDSTLTISYVNTADDVPEITGNIVLDNTLKITEAKATATAE